MTSITAHPGTSTPAQRTARGSAHSSASSRPVAAARASGWTLTPRQDALRTRTVARAKIATAIVALLASVALVVLTPQTVMIPLGVVLVTGLFAGSLLHLVEVRTRSTPTAPDRPDHLTRRIA